MILAAEINGRGYGHPRNPPALADGKDVAANVADRVEKSRRWTQVLEQRFPTGSGAQNLQDTLRSQGFKITPSHGVASYDWGGMPCLYTLNVSWTEDARHRIATIKGDSYSGCL
jgi:hypothetical protein